MEPTLWDVFVVHMLFLTIAVLAAIIAELYDRNKVKDNEIKKLKKMLGEY